MRRGAALRRPGAGWVPGLLLAAACALLAANGAAAAPATAVDPVVADPLANVAPELKPAVAALRARMPDFGLNAGKLAGLRAMKWVDATPKASPPWERRLVPGDRAGADVPVFVINAGAAGANRPVLFYIHGGGFVMGKAENELPALQELALAHDCVVIAVEYRLSPETRYPGPVDDLYAGLRWLYGNADSLGVDRRRIVILGESAGGGLAAMLAIAARDRHEIPVAAQVLIYPMLDDRTGSSRAVPASQGQLLWTRASNRFGWQSFLGKASGDKRVPYGAVPARVADLRGLPPAFVGVGSIDLFAQEDVDYAGRLVAAGVRTELVVVPGAYHAFEHIAADAPQSRQFTAAVSAYVARAFGVK